MFIEKTLIREIVKNRISIELKKSATFEKGSFLVKYNDWIEVADFTSVTMKNVIFLDMSSSSPWKSAVV
jgi:hypothetical protein